MVYFPLMAIPPTVPTSFLPQQSFSPRSRNQIDLGGAFAFVCYAAFVVSLLAAIGVFAYQKILESRLASKEAELAKAQSSIDESTVKSLIELRNRLSAGKQLLDSHVAFSGFFTTLEQATLKNVHLASSELNFGEGHVAKLTLIGTAKNFNALAAQSQAFTNAIGFKDAIFSNITIQQGGGVSFTLSANLDPSIIAFGASPAAHGSATTTPATP